MDKQPPSESRPGRKRSEESRMAILVAAFELVDEVGYAGLTIEGIANRAGCGKQTIYRWWPSRAHVLLEALAVKADLYVTNADHGSYADDVRAFLEDTFRLGRQQRVVDILRVLMAEAQINEEFGQLFRSAFLQRRRDALQVVLDRARTRGDLPPRPAASTVLDIVFGTLWYRLLATRQPMGNDLVEELTATLAQAAHPATNTAIDLGDQQ
ncbi:TetR/AcrR family transcriptional regulator [Streptomyces sp. NBC_00316]|uniref:TetR/AcrR family transcriptional regulator n=1 Tax=Streptomyces sp. NBC_00316 TaxID=2975710 RepID=UPI002E2D6562|nr:TetR/AcrR family transcriptional regulator [Streptomyces sp. NBC_00316]